MNEQRAHTLGTGLIAGLIGYFVVAVVLALLNLAAGRSAFYTAAALGAALFYGVNDPAAVTITPTYVLAYNGLHLLVFLALGMLGAWLAALSERAPQLWFVGFFFFLFTAFHMMAAMQAFTMLRTAISPWTVWAAGIMAAMAMGAYVLSARPALRRGMRHWDEEPAA